MSAIYDALVVDEVVYVFAFGENTTSGWKNYFQKSLLTIYPPKLSFIQEAPTGVALEVITPYFVVTSFPYDPTIKPKSLEIADDEGSHTVDIRTAATIAERVLIERGVSSRVLLPGNKRLISLVGKLKAKNLETFYERSLGSYEDLLSQHCTTECVKVEELDRSGIKLCTEYRTVCQHIRVNAVLVVRVGKPQDIANAVESSLQKATIASAIAAFLVAFATGGSGAAASAKATFVAVFAAELSQSLADLLVVDVDFRTEWV